ncbi:MAG: hypothetical protein JSU86_15055 [Phycisphaerales bacterium]|nr:MAG: hypothetical protein JSU86_15055 [Phycisphaerales bacterium]
MRLTLRLTGRFVLLVVFLRHVGTSLPRTPLAPSMRRHLTGSALQRRLHIRQATADVAGL